MTRHAGLRARTPIRPAAVLTAAALLVTAGACVLRKPPDAKAIQADGMPHVVPPAQWAAARTAGPAQDNWLVTFNDQALNAAVDEALLYNADLRVGAARVEQANLVAKQAGARLYPSVDLLARGGGKMSGDNSGLAGGAII